MHLGRKDEIKLWVSRNNSITKFVTIANTYGATLHVSIIRCDLLDKEAISLGEMGTSHHIQCDAIKEPSPTPRKSRMCPRCHLDRDMGEQSAYVLKDGACVNCMTPPLSLNINEILR